MDSEFTCPWNVKFFTDNVIIGYGLYSGEERVYGLGEVEFGSIISIIQQVQLECALRGWFLRGGWADGNLFIDDKTAFGSALIEAHHLESETAIFPRIVLSDRMKNRINIHLSYYGYNDYAPQLNSLFIDSSLSIAVNYLDVLLHYNNLGGIDNPDNLQIILLEHKNKVLEKLKKHKNNNKIYKKYEWVAAYHNYFCDSIQDLPVVANHPYEQDYILVPMRRHLSEEIYIFDNSIPNFGLRKIEKDDMEPSHNKAENEIWKFHKNNPTPEWRH